MVYNYIIRNKEINTTGDKKMRKFEIGKEYKTRSAYDHTHYFTAKVVSRTAKTATVIDDLGREIRCKILADNNGDELIKTSKCATVFA